MKLMTMLSIYTLRCYFSLLFSVSSMSISTMYHNLKVSSTLRENLIEISLRMYITPRFTKILWYCFQQKIYYVCRGKACLRPPPDEPYRGRNIFLHFNNLTLKVKAFYFLNLSFSLKLFSLKRFSES